MDVSKEKHNFSIFHRVAPRRVQCGQALTVTYCIIMASDSDIEIDDAVGQAGLEIERCTSTSHEYMVR